MQINKTISIIVIIISVLALSLVRGFEQQLFYDPFLSFFRGEYHHKTFPELDLLKINFSYLLRFSINSVISLVIILFWFKNIKTVKNLSIIYLFSFLILIILFNTLFIIDNQKLMSLFFYVRRFLIHPMLVLLFIPALLYQKSVKSND